MDKPARIFITGGTGFIGSYIIKYLLHYGYTNITALKRKESPIDLVKNQRDQVDWLEGDLMDEYCYQEILDNTDYVIHTAAMIGFDPSAKKKMYELNIKGTANLINHCLDRPIKKFVHISSTAAIGRFKKEQEIDEDSEWQKSIFNSHYAITKHLSEMEVWRGAAEGLNMVIINPSVVLGAGFWKNGSSNLFFKAWKGIPFYPKGKTGYVDVRDVAKMTIHLMESEITNERFICNGGNPHYSELFKYMFEGFDKKGPSSPLPSWLGAIAWRVEKLKSLFSGKAPMITKETIRLSQNKYTYLNQKSREQLNYSYKPLEDSIKEAAKALRHSQENGLNHSHLPLI